MKAPAHLCACGALLPAKHGRAGTHKTRCWDCEANIARDKKNAANRLKAAEKAKSKAQTA